MGRPGTVVEHMAEMRITNGTQYLDAPHAVATVSLGLDVIFVCGRPETRPAGAGIKFCIRAEQDRSTRHTLIRTLFVIVPVLSGKCSFRGFSSGDFVLIRSKLPAPFLIGFYDSHFGSFLRNGFL